MSYKVIIIDNKTNEVVINKDNAKAIIGAVVGENGVIVLPCKVGDVVYCPYKGKIYESIVEEIDVYRNNVFFYTDDAICFDETVIGHEVFFTREEAEKKLVRDNDVLSKNEDMKGGED